MMENNGKLLKVAVWPGVYTKIEHIGKSIYCFNKQGSHMALCRAVQCYYHHRFT